jgi:hypothetical protein
MADRNPSKKRRQSQNEAAREARANRSAAARAGSAATAAADEGTKAGKSGSIFSRGRTASTSSGARPARTAAGVARATGTASPARPSRAAATKATPPGRKNGSTNSKASPKAGADDGADRSAKPRASGRPSKPLPPWLDRFGGNEPGGRWIVFSFIAAVVASLTMSFAKVMTDVNSKTGKALQVRDPVTHKLHNAPPVTAFQHGAAQGLATVLPVPLVIGFTLLLSRPPNHRRTWYFGLAALFLLIVLAGGSPLYLPAIGIYGFGCWQARKAALLEAGGDPKVLKEQDRAARSAGRRRTAATDAAVDELDTEEVDTEEVDEVDTDEVDEVDADEVEVDTDT